MWRSHSHRKRRGGGKGPLSSTNREGETAKQLSMENDQNNPTYLKLTSDKELGIYVGKRRRRKICTPYLEAVADSSLKCRLTVLVIEVPQGMRGGITERSDMRHLTVRANADIKTRASIPGLRRNEGKNLNNTFLEQEATNVTFFRMPQAEARAGNGCN